MCSPAPVALQARDDILANVPGTHDLGIVRDPERCAQRRSAHCCGDRAENPAARSSNYVHAWDCGHAIGDRITAALVVDIFLADPRVDYVISFGVLYKPDGTTQNNTGHEDHVHVTFDPSTTHDTRPFNTGADDVTIDELQQELVNQDKRTRAVLEAELAPIRQEVEGLKKRTQLIRRIARAVAHKAGVTQSEIEAQA